MAAPASPAGPMRRALGWYGAGPLHLLALLASFAFAAYVADRLVGVSHVDQIGIWFIGALIGHDLFLFPLYALADRSAGLAARRHPERLPTVPWANYLRAPALISGVLLLITFPLVLRLDPSDYRVATGLTPSPYLGRWLIVTAVLFFASAVLYALRLVRATKGARRQDTR